MRECVYFFAGLKVPDPVCMCAIEVDSISQQRALDLALANLTREDPSLRYNHNSRLNINHLEQLAFSEDLVIGMCLEWKRIQRLCRRF